MVKNHPVPWEASPHTKAKHALYKLEPQTAALRRLILDHLEILPGRRAVIHQLRAFALHNTVFKESQASIVVREMVDERELMRLDGESSAIGLSASNVVSLPLS